jgi:hypothetical protein
MAMKRKEKIKLFQKILEKKTEDRKEVKELDEMADLYQGINQIEVPEPSASMKEKFYQQVDNMENANNSSQPISAMFSFQESGWIKLAAAVLLIIGGSVLGFIFNSNIYMKKQLADLSSEINNLRSSATIAVLSEQTASVKLEAIYNAAKSTNQHTELINALYNSMVSDENSNVRLAAAQALTHYLPNENVKSMLIESLELQDDPIVQISIINILSNIKQEETIKAIQSFINKENIDSEIKNYARDIIHNTSI